MHLLWNKSALQHTLDVSNLPNVQGVRNIPGIASNSVHLGQKSYPKRPRCTARYKSSDLIHKSSELLFMPGGGMLPLKILLSYLFAFLYSTIVVLLEPIIVLRTVPSGSVIDVLAVIGFDVVCEVTLADFCRLRPALPPVERVAFLVGALFFALHQEVFITTGGCKGSKSSGISRRYGTPRVAAAVLRFLASHSTNSS